MTFSEIDTMTLVDIRYNIRGRKGQQRFFGYTYTKGNQPVRIVINLRPHWLATRKEHRGHDRMIQEIISTIDHEIVHAFSPLGRAHKGDVEPYEKIYDETLAANLEREGWRARHGYKQACGLRRLRV